MRQKFANVMNVVVVACALVPGCKPREFENQSESEVANEKIPKVSPGSTCYFSPGTKIYGTVSNAQLFTNPVKEVNENDSAILISAQGDYYKVKPNWWYLDIPKGAEFFVSHLACLPKQPSGWSGDKDCHLHDSALVYKSIQYAKGGGGAEGEGEWLSSGAHAYIKMEVGDYFRILYIRKINNPFDDLQGYIPKNQCHKLPRNWSGGSF